MKRCSILALILVTSCALPILGQPCPPAPSWCSGLYQYDGMGNIRAIGNDTFVYDTAGRLVSGTADVQRTGVMSRQNYSYDAFGNRISASRAPGSVDCLGGCEQSPTIDPATNHIISNGAVYDAAGNLKSIQYTINNIVYTSNYEYDGAGSLTRATAGSDDRQFIYTADDERIAVKNGASWTWTIRGLDGKVLREFTSLEQNGLPTANRQWAKDYVWRDGLLLATVAPTTPGASTTTTLHYHLDHLGTPRVVTNDSGVQVGIHAYYPFGAELNLSPTEQPAELMKFTGHERDLLASNPNTLDYMHARYDMATMGRFLSVDPTWSSADLGKPQSWNRYAYVLNNPVRYTDPDGRCTDVITCTVEGGLVGGLPGALIGAGVGGVVGWGLTHPDKVAIVGNSMGSGSGGERFAESWIRQNNANHMAEKQDGAKPTTDPKRRFSKEDRQAGLDKSKDAKGTPRCEHCGNELNPNSGSGNSYEADHRDPHAQGGQSTQDNLAPSCRDCNREKGNRTPEQWKKDKKEREQQ